MMINPITAPICGKGRIIPTVRNAGFTDPSGTTSRSPTVVGQGLNNFVTEVLEQPGISVIGPTAKMMQTNIPPTAVIGVVPGETIQRRTHRDLQNIPGPFCPRF